MLNKKAVLLSTGLGIGLVGFSGLASADEVYTIQQGDTVSSIANKFNTTIDEIEKKNHFEDVNMIYVGEQLTIPTLTVQYKESTPVQVQSVSVQQETTVQQPVQKAEPKQQVASSGGSVNAYRERRKQIESNGNYATNTGNGYWGAYQFAPATVRGIEAETGMKWDWSPKTQDAFADYYAQTKYNGWQNVPTTGGW